MAGRTLRTAAITIGVDIRDHRISDGYEPPKVWWNPSISPAGLIIYSGELFPQWKGDALLGALSGEALIHVRIRGDRASKADQWAMGHRIREVEQGPRGEVYLLEDEDGARLLRLDFGTSSGGRCEELAGETVIELFLANELG